MGAFEPKLWLHIQQNEVVTSFCLLLRGIVDAVGTEVRKYNILLPHQLSAGSHESTTNTVGDSHNAVDGVEADENDVTQNNRQVRKG